MSEITVADELNLYDDEVQKLLQIVARLQAKYSTRRASFENLNALSSEAMDLFEGAGFIATVSVLDEGMNPILPPSITIHGRVDPKDFDPDRQQWEVKKGVAQDERVEEFLKKGGTSSQRTEVQATVEAPEKQSND